MVDSTERDRINRTLDDLVPPNLQPNENPSKRYKTKTNHDVKVLNTFNVDRTRMVELSIRFDQNENFPGRENTSYEVIIPMQSIGSSNPNKAVEEIRQKLFNQTPYQLFVSSPQKYCRDLMGKLFHFEEKERRGIAVNKTVFSFDRPTPFDVDGVVYLCAGDIWQISDPIKKLSSNERKELPIIIEYTGERVDFEKDEKVVVKTMIDLVNKFIYMQEDDSVNGFPVAYMSRSVQNALFTVLLKKYRQPVTYTSSGKNEEGIAKTGIGKSLMSKVTQLMLKGFSVQGGEFSESYVFKKVSVGEHCVCDELHLNRRDTLKGLKAVICSQFQGLERMIGSGGTPKATVVFHSNKPPSDLKLPNEVRERVIWLYAGFRPLRPDGVLQMFDDAKELYKYLPSTLGIGVQSFYEPIPDESRIEFMNSLGDMAHMAQEFWNLRCFHEKLRTLARKHDIAIPNWLSRDVDFRPYLQTDPGDVAEGEEPKTIADFLSALDSEGFESECAMDTYKRKRGLRIWSSVFEKCPKWMKTHANRLPSSARDGRRFRFVEEFQHPFISKIKSKGGFMDTESSDSDTSSSESSDDEESPIKPSKAAGNAIGDNSETSDSDSSDDEETAKKSSDAGENSESSEEGDAPRKSLKARGRSDLDSSDGEPDSSNVDSSMASVEPDYTANDDLFVIRAIIETKSTGKVMDDDFWKLLKSSYVGQQYLPAFSWESIRNRFHTEVVPNLELFDGLSPENIKAIRKGMGLQSPDEDGAHSENASGDGNIATVPINSESQIDASVFNTGQSDMSPASHTSSCPGGTQIGFHTPVFSPTKSHEGDIGTGTESNSPPELGSRTRDDLHFEESFLNSRIHDELNESDQSVQSEKRKNNSDSSRVEKNHVNEVVVNKGTTANVQNDDAEIVQNEEFKCQICLKIFQKKRGLSCHARVHRAKKRL